jgi:hypothetical protein
MGAVVDDEHRVEAELQALLPMAEHHAIIAMYRAVAADPK